MDKESNNLMSNLLIDEVTIIARDEIELLKEYKTALISEVVTGKVDVKEEKMI